MMRPITRNLLPPLSAIYLAFFHAPAFALDWKIRPNLNVKEIYSDNITLAKNKKKSALVTEITPGVSINGTSSRGSVDLNYNLQGIYNAQGRSDVEFFNQLQMNSDYEIVRKSIFVDSNASVSQQNTSNRRIANDNISGDEESATISTFRISPYWTPHLKGFADGEVRLTYDTVNSEGGTNALSDTNSFAQNVFLRSGHDFSVFSWSISFNNSNRKNSDSEDISFQNSQVELRYAIDRHFDVFVRGGHSSNSFDTNSDSSNNGLSYTFGGQWEPSKRLRLEGGYGNNKFITIEISPFDRLHWISTYTNNDIGLNTNSTWNTQFDYTTRRSIWNISYSEDTTTTQEVLLDQQVSNNAGAGFSNRNTRLPTLTDEVFITKKANLTYTFKTGKSDISATIFKTIRSFELSGNEEEVTGASASWDWDFARRTSSSLRLGWQETESDGNDNFSDTRFDFSFSITRNILSHLNGSIEYTYINQDSDDNFNTYSENRISANLSLQF